MVTVLDSLNTALLRALAGDERVYILGEDVLDPYGGAFKVTRGLSTKYPHRVITTPVSEAGITGVAAGMALRGLRPVVEIMFGDFITLIADQLINHISKFRWMFSGGKAQGDAIQMPLLVRTPAGGRRGYGPTHSQSLEKHFLGVPGLKVVAPSAFGDPGDLLFHLITESVQPVLFVENKLLYTLPVIAEPGDGEITVSRIPQADQTPVYRVAIREAPPPALTIAAYGYMADLARQAILLLAYEHELFAECVILSQLAPFKIEPILESARRTGSLLVVEEGALSLGWGAEIIARSVESSRPNHINARRVGAKDLPVPASPALEETVLPGVPDIVAAALEMRA